MPLFHIHSLVSSILATLAAQQIAHNPLPPGKRRPGSVGLPAGPDVAIMSETGEILAQGGTGEIVIRGENVMRGYATLRQRVFPVHESSRFQTTAPLHLVRTAFKIRKYRILSPLGARMIYSRSAEYAIRAFVYLAQVPETKFTMVKQIAEQEEIPAHFLAKILQQLARKGLLRSSKGPTGGFSLRLPPEDVSLLNIVEALDGLQEYQRCASGLAECNDDMPCGMHESWKALRSRIIDYLEGTSVADVAEALEEKRRALEKPRRAKRSAAKSKRK